jgi:hypothetical protein
MHLRERLQVVQQGEINDCGNLDSAARNARSVPLVVGGSTQDESRVKDMLNDEVDSTNCRVSVESVDCRSSSKQAEQKQLKLVNA